VELSAEGRERTLSPKEGEKGEARQIEAPPRKGGPPAGEIFAKFISLASGPSVVIGRIVEAVTGQ
jgi:hypothetical protein